MNEEPANTPVEPQNRFLMETFKGFCSEGLSRTDAMTMTQAHVAHGQWQATERVAKALERISDLHTDPVALTQFQAITKAASEKREERRVARSAEVGSLNSLLKDFDAEKVVQYNKEREAGL